MEIATYSVKMKCLFPALIFINMYETASAIGLMRLKMKIDHYWLEREHTTIEYNYNNQVTDAVTSLKYMLV